MSSDNIHFRARFNNFEAIIEAVPQLVIQQNVFSNRLKSYDIPQESEVSNLRFDGIWDKLILAGFRQSSVHLVLELH